VSTLHGKVHGINNEVRWAIGIPAVAHCFSNIAYQKL